MDAIPGRPLHHDLSEIKRAAERAASLTKQLQVFARKELIVTKAMDMNGAVTAMLDMLKRLTHGRATIEWHPGDDVGDVFFDEGQLDQILANMVTNACDASGSVPCVITLSTRVISVTSEKAVSLGLGTAGEYVQLTISDNGSGMSEEVVAHIFEPFYTTKPIGSGTGLGLAIVYGIVKKNDGHISVVSKLNKGTQFDIYLPRCKDSVPAAANVETTKPVAPKIVNGQGKTVVVVDDETAVSNLMGSALERGGYKVLKFVSAAEALAMPPEQWRSVDLVISDVLMPGMNGITFVESLLQQYPALKYLFISGHTSNLLTKSNTLIDEAHFMRKPFTPAQLIQKVGEVLAAAARP